METLFLQQRIDNMMLSSMHYHEIINAIIKRQNGFITSENLRQEGVPSYAFAYFLRSHPLRKEAKGFYSDPSWIRDEYFLFQYRYPQYIYSYQSALFLWGLSDRAPEHLEVSGPKNYRPLGSAKSEVIRHVIRQEEIYQLGIKETRTVLGNTIRVYSPEKTLVDLIKHRKDMDPEVFVKALKAFCKREDKKIPLVLDYAEKMGIREKTYDLLEVCQ